MPRALPLICVFLPLALVAGSGHAQGIRRCTGADGTTIFTDRSCEALGAAPAGEFIPDGARGGGGAATMGINGAVGGFAIRGCARSPDALLHGVRDALQAHDVNKLANYYHWTGTGASAAVALMDRLERIANRPLAGVELSFPQQAAFYAPPPEMLEAPRAAEVYRSAYVEDPRARPGPSYLASLQHPEDAGIEVVDAELVPVADDEPLTPADVGAPAELQYAPAAPAYSPPAYSASAANPIPVGLRVLQASSGTDPGSASAAFGLRRNAGCWWIQF